MSNSFEEVKKFLLKEGKKYKKKAITEEMKEAKAVAKLAKMKDFSLYYDDDKFNAVTELGYQASYDEGSWDSEWN